MEEMAGGKEAESTTKWLEVVIPNFPCPNVSLKFIVFIIMFYGYR